MGKNKGHHPCLDCGACCASFRVSFYWQESLESFGDWTVPIDKAEVLDAFHLNMKGTNQKNPLCQCLKGIVGQSVSCEIYENRPSPCRNFQASYEFGERNIRCDEARFRHGLAPLKPEDWLVPIDPNNDPQRPKPKKSA